MDRGEIKQHLKAILENITTVRSIIRDINYGEFRRNVHIRQQVYDCIRGIGISAHKLIHGQSRLERDIALDTLATFRDVRYDEVEPEDEHVWNLVELDLSVISDEIKQLNILAEASGSDSVAEVQPKVK